MGKKILIIEDEKDLAKILGAYLEVEGFEAEIASDGQEGLKLFEEIKPSLVLLDIMLPKVDGIQVCKKIRESSDVPVIMISAKNGEMDKVIALGIGADDYVTKPFSPLELVARVKAQLRRYEKTMEPLTDSLQELSLGRLRLNKTSYTVWIDEETVSFTTKEFDMLYYLASHENQVFTKEQIYQGVWGYSEIGEDNSVTVYINRLRDKLSKYQIDYIKTVWGVGYKMTTVL
ncbi:MAG: response regulator transcription factor [Clostridiales bacterium]|nr:response regulator transcription factor [Clostridiales bacterium]